jgi:imidazolonepropionase-like amidohydrolase
MPVIQGGAMTTILFRNLALLDPRWSEARGGYEVLVEGDRIRELSDTPIKAAGARVVDCGGRTLMPGLIDCHVHVYLVELGLARLEAMPLTLLTAKASKLMRDMLDRGFTTVRDTGGADWGIKEAVETGVLAGPRLFISGRPISMTGGHGDSRRRTAGDEPCKCCNALSFVLETADGIDGVRKAVREQMRQGADQIKIFVSGGVASPWDPLDSLQYSPAEIAAAVEEAHNFGRYVLAHAYTPEAITRAVTAGVRTIEHGNLIDDQAAKLMAERGALMVANLVAYYAMKERAVVRDVVRSACQERPRYRRRVALARDRQACGRTGRLRQRSLGTIAGRSVARVSVPRRSAFADRNHPPGDAGRRRCRAPDG